MLRALRIMCQWIILKKVFVRDVFSQTWALILVQKGISAIRLEIPISTAKPASWIPSVTSLLVNSPQPPAYSQYLYYMSRLTRYLILVLVIWYSTWTKTTFLISNSIRASNNQVLQRNLNCQVLLVTLNVFLKVEWSDFEFTVPNSICGSTVFGFAACVC